ncbi:MAG TPA: putative toxin-antitoxin system toxin component, PIN family [Candidatus Dormibacteraeota bacterium]|nr:putative toxin-antitoxin system toxin component, PIN family [Candidatus Dormibacteraeota bacterium]
MAIDKNIRVVIDSNVWISGLIFGGKPEKIIKLFLDGDFLVIVSAELLSELRRKIIEKFPLFTSSLESLDASILNDAIVVRLGSQTVNISRDPDDNKVIETAIIGHCNYIVSGDKDLLAVGSYKNISIVNPTDFLKIID